MEVAGEKSDALRGKLEVAARIYGENSDQVSRLQRELNYAETAEAKIAQQIGEVTSQLEKQASEAAESQTALGQLTAKISEQESELADLKTEYVNAVLEFGKTSSEAQELAGEIDQLSGELKENKGTLEDAEKSADELDKTYEDTADSTNLATEATDKLQKGYTVLKGVVANLITDALLKLGQELKDTAKFVMDTGMAAESGFSRVQAVSEATAEEMVNLKAVAIDLAEETKYSLGEAAGGLYAMGQAGWSATQQAKGLAGVMYLAAAAEEDLATASEITVTTLNALNYEAEEATRLADVLAVGAAATTTGVAEMGETFKYAAPVAGTLGYSLEDLAIATGLMADNGIKGSQAGTSLRTMLTNLAAPTTKAAGVMEDLGISLTDTNGNMLSLGDLMSQMRSAFAGLTVDLYDASGQLKDYDTLMAEAAASTDGLGKSNQLAAAATIFGKYALSGSLSVLTASEERYRELTSAIYDSEGAARDMAAAMQDNLAGDLEKAGGKLETVATTLYDKFSPAMREAVQAFTAWLDTSAAQAIVDQIGETLAGLFATIRVNMPQIMGHVQGMASALPGLLQGAASGISWVVENIDGLVTGIKAIVVTWGVIKALQVTNSIVGLVSHIAGLAAATGAATAATTLFGAAMTALPWVAAAAGAALVVTGIVKLVQWIGSLGDNAEECNTRIAAVTGSVTAFGPALNSVSPNITSVNSLLSSMGRTTGELDQIIAQTENAITQTLSTALKEQRQLRTDELASIASYNEQIKAMQREKMEMYRQNLQVELAQIIAEEGRMTQQAAVQYNANIKEMYAQANAAAEAHYDQQVGLLRNHHQAQGTLNSEAFRKDIAAARDAHQAELNENKAFYDQGYASLLANASRWVEGDMGMWRQLYSNSRAGREQYTSNLERMDLDNANAFLSMLTAAKKAGVDIPNETKEMAKDILSSFKDLPPNLKQQGDAALQGLIKGLDSQIPALKNVSDKSADTIVDTICRDLEISSPSRKLTRIGQDTIEGLGQGIAGKESTIKSTVSKIANTIETTIKAPVSQMRGIGANMVEGLGQGVESKESWLGSQLRSFANGILNTFKKVFQIKSPSQVFADEIGAFIPPGIGVGIERNMRKAIAPLQALRDQMVNAFGAEPLDISANATLGDRVNRAGEQAAAASRLNDLVQRLADRPINVYLNGHHFMTAVASDADAVNGQRLNLAQRGLALP